MKPRFVLSSLAALFLSFMPSTALATPSSTSLLTDSFIDTSHVDMNNTDAWVDTGNHWVEAWHTSQANVVDAQANPNGLPQDLVVATQTGIDWYTVNDSTGKMQLDNVNSMTQTDALGVALVPNSSSYWVFTQSGTSEKVQLAEFNGSGMVANPAMAVSGLSNIAAISSVDSESVATIDKSGQVNVYTYNDASGSMSTNPSRSFATGLQNVRSVHVIPNGNVVVTTVDGSCLYEYNQATGTYQKNTSLSVKTTGAKSIVAGTATSDANQLSLLDPTAATPYEYNQATGAMQSSNLYTEGSLNHSVAVALPSGTSTVIASSDGTVSTYEFNQSTGSMDENANLQVSGLSFNKNYSPTSIYQSVPFGSGQQFNMFQLTPSEQDDPGTSVAYDLSVDGGNTFQPITPNVWTHFPVGSQTPSNVAGGSYIVKATLTSADSSATPRITNVSLQAYLDTNPPTAPGMPTGNPNPSYQTSTSITWTPATDDTGIGTYFFRYSTDGGNTWTNWMDTGSNTPGYTLTVPDNTAVTYSMQVKARDLAGNDSPISPTGSVFIDTVPLGIVTTANGSELTVTDIKYPSTGQAAPPTDALPVHVQAGGEVTYQLTTSGNAQSVVVTYTDGLTQTLSPLSSPSAPQNNTTWEGYYYPSSTQTIPINAPQGETIGISDIKVTRTASSYDATSSLLVINGSIGNGTYLVPHLVE